MYKVVLVDDEKYVLKSLEARVNWSEYGFEIAGEAVGGAEAYEMICKIKPEVVFTDIKMPGMSGLELIKGVKEMNLGTMFIVVSGHAEFAYAQKAINYGAIGYCLKPFDDEEIIGYLKKMRGMLENSKTYDEIEIMDLLEENDENSVYRLKEILLKFGIEINLKKDLYIFVSIGKNKLKFNDIDIKLTLKIGHDKYAYFAMVSGVIDINHCLKDTNMENIRGIGISKEIKSVEAMKASLDETEIMAYNYFTTCRDKIGLSDATGSRDEDNYVQKLDEYINSNDIEAVVALLEGSVGAFLKGQLNIKHVIIIYNNIMSLVYRLRNEHFEEYVYNYDKIAKLFNNVKEMILYLKALLIDSLNVKENVNHEKTMNYTFKKILKHVNENFCSDISAYSLSKDFNINANYISQLFKKEAGITFTEYLGKLRIDYACKLLKDTDIPISEISEKVGYNDYFYFSRVFKKIKGKSPSSYKKDCS